MSSAVFVEGLTHRYGDRVAIDNLSFDVRPSEIFGLLGPNGGGKTTLFRLLSTLLPIESGRIEICGHDVASHPAVVRHNLGVTFQAPALDGRLTVLENMKHQGRLYGLAGAELRNRIEELLQGLRVADRRNDPVDTLSGGLKRRVEIAKGLLHKPPVLLLDEPATGLDPAARRDFWTHLEDLREQQQMTILVTTHLMEIADRCDRLAILDRGRLVACDSPAALRSSVGGDCLSIQSPQPQELLMKLRDHIGIDADGRLVDDVIRIERENGHELLRNIVSEFPDDVSAISLGRPTLEDVFVARTGHRFVTEEA